MPFKRFAGADSLIYDCNALLTDQITYDVANDLPDQRNALIDFYNSTGGPYWDTALLSDALRAELANFELYLEELGAEAASSTFNLSALTPQYQEIVEVLEAYSVNCTLQRQLQIVKLLLKSPWNTAGTPGELVSASMHCCLHV